jgi:HK97 family phage portal protein
MAWFRRSIENPNVPLSSSEIVKYLGPAFDSYSGESVSPEGSLALTAVFRSVALIAGTIGGFPLKAFRERADGKEPVKVRWLEEPSRAQTSVELWETVVTHLLLWGDAFLALERNGLGGLLFVEPVHPSRVTVESVPPSDLNPAGRRYTVTTPDRPAAVLGPDALLHIPGLGFDGLRGLSPVGVVRNALGSAQAAERAAARMWAQGLLQSVALTTDQPLTKDQAERIKSQFKARAQGADRAHDVPLLDSGLKTQQLSINPDDAQFIEARRFGVRDVARIFGVPPAFLAEDAAAPQAGSGVEEQGISLLTYTLRPHMRRIERRVSTLLPRGTRAEFLADDLLRGQTLDRYNAYHVALKARILNRNEVRELENRAPVPGGDDFDEFKADGATIAPGAQPPAPPAPAPPAGEEV